jgi:hypothetical protein
MTIILEPLYVVLLAAFIMFITILGAFLSAYLILKLTK